MQTKLLFEKYMTNDAASKETEVIQLSNETKISGNTWSELKERAMQPDYISKSEFVNYLTQEEKVTLQKLIEA